MLTAQGRQDLMTHVFNGCTVVACYDEEFTEVQVLGQLEPERMLTSVTEYWKVVSLAGYVLDTLDEGDFYEIVWMACVVTECEKNPLPLSERIKNMSTNK